MRSKIKPTKCIHGINPNWCAVCAGLKIRPASGSGRGVANLITEYAPTRTKNYLMAGWSGRMPQPPTQQ